MYNSQYYETKKQKLNQKFEQKKNAYLKTLFDLTNNIQNDLNEMQQEYKETEKEEAESKLKEEIKTDKK